MKLTQSQKEILIDMGTPETDFARIEDALNAYCTKYMYYVNKTGRTISKEKAIKLLGERKFISGISRSAFHWSAVRYIDDNCEEKGYIYFDSSNLFKRK